MRRRRPRKPPVAESSAGDVESAGAAAVALLSRRDFAGGELAARLAEQGYAEATVAEVIADLAGRHLIDDARFAAHFVSYHAERGHGPARIRRDLAERGLPATLIDEALAGGPDWSQRARELRIRKFGLQAPATWPEKARQARFLQYRGFSTDHIRSALGADLATDQ